MICRYPEVCKGLGQFLIGDWSSEILGTGLFLYRVKNTRTQESALYGVVLAKPRERPVWLNTCPICAVNFGPWLQSGRVKNGTISVSPAS